MNISSFKSLMLIPKYKALAESVSIQKPATRAYKSNAVLYTKSNKPRFIYCLVHKLYEDIEHIRYTKNLNQKYELNSFCAEGSARITNINKIIKNSRQELMILYNANVLTDNKFLEIIKYLNNLNKSDPQQETKHKYSANKIHYLVQTYDLRTIT